MTGSYRKPGILWRRDPRMGSDALPLVFDTPHSGVENPADFGFVCDPLTIVRGADLYVDELYADAPHHGATMIGAEFPRAYIDTNREETDIYHPILEAPHGDTPPRPGLKPWNGLVRSRNWRNGADFYERKLSLDEVQGRIATYYRPYHSELKGALDRLHRRFGAVWHVNCHSCGRMNRTVDPPRPNADIILGDRRGSTCDGDFTTFVAETLAALGYDVEINTPYQGATLVRRYGAPENDRHSLQIEINKRLYLDDASKDPQGFETLQRNISRLIEAIGRYVRDQIDTHVPR